MASSSSNAANGDNNNGQTLPPSPNNVKGNDSDGSVNNNGATDPTINVPSVANSSFPVTSSPAINPYTNIISHGAPQVAAFSPDASQAALYNAAAYYPPSYPPYFPAHYPMAYAPSQPNLPFPYASSPVMPNISCHCTPQAAASSSGAPQAALSNVADLELQKLLVEMSRLVTQMAQSQLQTQQPQKPKPTVPKVQHEQVPQVEIPKSEATSTSVGFCVNAIESSVDVEISFDNFPYYLSERTKHDLVASYFIHTSPELQHPRHRVLLSGPKGSELYQETLAMTLSRKFGVKLLVFDCKTNTSELLSFVRIKPLPKGMHTPSPLHATSQSPVPQPDLSPPTVKSHNQTFKIGDRVIFTGLKPDSTGSNIAPRGPSFGNCGKVVELVNNGSNRIGVRFDVPIPEGCDLGGICEASHGFLCDGSEICVDVDDDQGVCAESGLILFVKHAKKNLLIENDRAYLGLHGMVNKLPDSVFVIGSHIQKKSARQNLQKEHTCGRYGRDGKYSPNILKMLLNIFQDQISIEMPEDQKLLDEMKLKLDRDVVLLKIRENRAQLRRVLTQSGLECKDIETLSLEEEKLTDENAKKVVNWALGYELSSNPQNSSNLKLVLSQESIQYGLNNLRAVQTNQKKSVKSPKDIATDNGFEKKLLDDVILHNEIGVKFDDIGALDNIKASLKELVMLPLQRPELFSKGQLRKPCRGILLFGPPGTGKTMLAKAVANESGANFLNISMSSITSKWYGESEKYVKAIFSLASKLAPSVVFIDEADSLFGKRRNQESDVTRRIKNEFMMHWDGLRTKDSERVLVLAATNRPFDLDDAIIRRVPRRFMLNLPDAENRSKILKLILAEEELGSDVDLDEISEMTKGFSGSDLKSLCVAAAYHPVREILEKDELKSPEENPVDVRPLSMQDFNNACGEVRASVSNDTKSMEKLMQWNELYGAGGSSDPNAPHLTMFI